VCGYTHQGLRESVSKICCIVTQSVAVCCSVLQCVAVSYGELQTYVWIYTSKIAGKRVTSALQCVAVCCGVLRCLAVCCGVLQSYVLIAIHQGSRKYAHHKYFCSVT